MAGIIEIEPLIVCPFCRGTRQDYNIKHHKMMPCEWCSGRGYTSRYACKGCGRPANKYWPPKQWPIIRYCGLESCFSKLVKIHGKTVGVRPSGPYHPGPGAFNIVRAAQEIDRANSRFNPKDEMEALKARLMF